MMLLRYQAKTYSRHSKRRRINWSSAGNMFSCVAVVERIWMGMFTVKQRSGQPTCSGRSRHQLRRKEKQVALNIARTHYSWLRRAACYLDEEERLFIKVATKGDAYWK